jgi:hypothetical protein
VVKLLWLMLACGAPADPATVPDGAGSDGGSDDGGSDDGGSDDGSGGEDGDAGDGGADPAEELAEMAPVDLLIRLSLDLRGVRPTAEEIERVEADPAALEALTAAFLDDPRFGERVVALFSEVYLTRSDYFTLSADDFGLDDAPGFNLAVGEEPLRLLAYVAAEDLPWTEIVTADYTVASDLLVDAWPLEYTGEGGEAAGEGWRKARYTDGRPAAGILATNGMWWRYLTTDSNANRGRANQISRILLCNDYLTREIAFDRNTNLLDEEAIADAIANNPACVNCHNSLDPLAAYLYGFWIYNEASYQELSTYHPERERLYQDYLGVSPAFYGDPGDSLGHLGQQIAGDSRFPNCAVEQVYEVLLDRGDELADMDALTGHREVFLDSGLSLKALITSVVSDPRYRAADTADAAAAELGAATRKMADPELLASQVEALTGFRWTYYDYEMMLTDLVGLRTLAGGADGRTVARNAAGPNATLLLVQQRLAEAAASYAVAAEAELAPEQRLLFTEVDLTETSAEALIPQIQRLHLLIFGARVDADGEEVAANLGLWDELYAIEGDPAEAWAGLLTALLRDPDFLLY